MPRRERPGKEKGRPDPPAEIIPDTPLSDTGRAQCDRMPAQPHIHAQVLEYFQHGVDILDQRNVPEANRLIREHTRREHGQHGVLVAGRLVSPAKPLAALYHEPSHCILTRASPATEEIKVKD